MKRSIISILVCSSLLFAVSCSSSSEDVEDAKEDVQEANEKLEKEMREYEADLEKYREEVRQEIEANNQLIADLRARKPHNNKELQAAREAKIDDLQMRNEELKRRMDNYDGNDRSNWENFKSEVKHDLVELGKAIREFNTDDVKDQ